MASQKKTAVLVTETEHELADTLARLEQVRDKREAALIADDSGALDALEVTQSRLQRTAQRQQERLRLLQKQIEAEEQEAVEKRRQALRERFAKKLAEADQAAVELQETVARAVVLYRKIIDIRETARAAWPISDSSLNAAAGALEGAALSGSAVRVLLSYEFYRASADPFMGGVPGERRQLSLPGSTSPRIDQQLNPSAIKPFADALRQASEFAVNAISNKLDPLRAVGGEAVASVDGERTPAEQRFAALLKQQAELAADITPEGEAKYMAVVAELALLSNEVEQQQGANK